MTIEITNRGRHAQLLKDNGTAQLEHCRRLLSLFCRVEKSLDDGCDDDDDDDDDDNDDFKISDGDDEYICNDHVTDVYSVK